MSDQLPASVYHERVKLPMFNIFYHILVSDDLSQAAGHLEEMFSGLVMDTLPDTPGVTWKIIHPELGSNIVIMINTSTKAGMPHLTNTIVHQCCKLTWLLMEKLEIMVEPNNNEIQAFLMEELFREVYRVVNKGREENDDGPLDGV